MKISVQVIVHPDNDDTVAVVRDVLVVDRDELAPDTLGLCLDEAKDLLIGVQETMVEHQVNAALATKAPCPDCGRARRHKDSRQIVVRSLFGTLRLASPRWWHCGCAPHPAATFSPMAELLPQRITPELAYQQARFAGLMSYGLSADLLGELLPLGSRELLKAQGMTANQQVTFFTDGGEDIRQVPRYLNPDSEHYLDWFHITMRITVMTNMAKSLQPPPPDPEFELTAEVATKLIAEVREDLARLKWFLWHGNVFRALDTIDVLIMDLETLHPDLDKPSKMLVAAREFQTYLRANAGQIPNYGERYRAGEPIASSPAESAVNQVVSARMVKRQQMRWSPRGAHLLLQVRTRVLNDDLTEDFRRWYPAFSHHHPTTKLDDHPVAA